MCIRDRDNTIDKHAASAPSGSAKMPICLDDVDTSFLTAPAGKQQHTSHTPIGTTQKNPMGAFLNSGDGDEVEIVDESTEAENLLQRALDRSFDETNVGGSVFNVDTEQEEDSDMTTKATARVNYLLDNPDKALQLTSMLIAKKKRQNKETDSPAVNAMIDKFMPKPN